METNQVCFKLTQQPPMTTYDNEIRFDRGLKCYD